MCYNDQIAVIAARVAAYPLTEHSASALRFYDEWCQSGSRYSNHDCDAMQRLMSALWKLDNAQELAGCAR